MLLASCILLAAAAAADVPRSLSTRSLPDAEGGGAAPLAHASGGIRARLTAPLVDEPGDGRVWARGLDYRASLGADGLTFLPVFGPAAPREFPVRFAVRSAARDGAPLATGVVAMERFGEQVTLTHEGLREVHHLGLEGVEQTFVFDALPGQGDLVVEVDVATELTPVRDADGLRFTHPTLGGVAYGEAVVFDAAGRRAPIAREWAGDRITLTVPASFLAVAALPVTIDPHVTPFVNTFGVNDDLSPDVCYAGRDGAYWVVWQEYTSSANRDVYVTSFDSAGTQGSSLAIDITTDDWTTPRVAYHYGANRLLVVASELANGVGSVRGRLVDVAAGAVLGGELLLSTTGARKDFPDVGGNNSDSMQGTHFCVVWSFRVSATDHEAQYRIIGVDGSPVTDVVTVDSTPDDTTQTAISKSQGAGELVGDYWTMVWMRDSDADGLGRIEARRIPWNGAVSAGVTNLTVATSEDCSSPSVSSRLDEVKTAVNDRPSIVVYERALPSPGAPNGVARGIFGRVIVANVSYEEQDLTGVMQDATPGLDRREPHIGTDGDAWYLVYAEADHDAPAGTNYDVYYCSGHVARTTLGAVLALAERHQAVGLAANTAVGPRVATLQDGHATSLADDAAVVWVDLVGATGGALRGARVEIPTVDSSALVAVGRQYCDARDNGGAPVNGLGSSWMWIEGDQSLGSLHRAYCETVTPNALGYLLAGRAAANVDLPGGSAGRLCVASPGRFVNAVANSGAARAYATNFDPSALPTPTGTVAAATGETWYFQFWHRDTQLGAATSNFSNACALTFVP